MLSIRAFRSGMHGHMQTHALTCGNILHTAAFPVRPFQITFGWFNCSARLFVGLALAVAELLTALYAGSLRSPSICWHRDEK